ncbi:MAG TPA: pilus assembly PilX N-terminal domain-containing protein, partial [Actinomycetota bacterium]|nr:pilus assembly PilX N-terminal domain-containing protein [Actinomycetota bacterium]
MWRTLYTRTRDEESGVALVISIVLLSVIGTLSVTMLSVGSHSDQTTARSRHSVQALHVAESGVEQAIAKIEDAGGSFSGSFTGATEEGRYEVIVTAEGRNRFTIESRGGVRAQRRLGAERVLRVTLAPPSVFKHALFSYTTLETKNNDVIEGDAWANQSVILASGTTVSGSVTGATGYVLLKGGAVVNGDANAGGFNASRRAITLENNAQLLGKATASVTAPPDPVSCG